jgi:energy-coupling factor transporter transmembrane protein EcfT
MDSRPSALLLVALFVVMIAAAVMLWWINTVLSMILIVLSLSVLVLGTCYGSTVFGVQDSSRAQNGGEYSTRYLDQFMRDLSERMERDLAEAAEDKQRASLAEGLEALESNPKDIHRIPPTVINGIGSEYSKQLVGIGITRIEELADADPGDIAEQCGVALEEAEVWVFDASAIVHGARIASIIELSMSVPEEILEHIEKSVHEGRLELPEDYEISMWSVRQWIEGANRAITGKGSGDLDRWWRRRR